jgi:hypothetical protein
LAHGRLRLSFRVFEKRAKKDAGAVNWGGRRLHLSKEQGSFVELLASSAVALVSDAGHLNYSARLPIGQ